MTYKVLRLSYQESKDVMCTGLKFAMANQDRWEDIDVDDISAHLGTYDYGTTYVVFDNIAYTIFKDYIFPKENQRLFILKNRELSTDIVD